MVIPSTISNQMQSYAIPTDKLFKILILVVDTVLSLYVFLSFDAVHLCL
jgi:hypothetical protein